MKTWSRILRMIVLMQLTGCGGFVVGNGTPPVDDDVDIDDDDDDASSPEQVPGTGDPDPDDDLEDADWIFSITQVHEINIELDQQAVSSLYGDPYVYVVGAVTFDDELLEEVGIRLKGRVGSFQDLSRKPAFKLDFNHAVPDQHFHSLEKLNLHNMVQDSAGLHERLAYTLWEAAGVPAPRVGYAWVRVNGEPYGLYTVVEAYDDRFLKRAFDDPSGNFYDGDYVYWPNGSYTLIDFNPATDQYFVLDEGVDVDLADIHGISDAIIAANGGDFWSEVGAVVDLDHHVRMWAVEAWVGHYDSYTYNSNNFRVYFDPVNGKAKLLPWDPDWAFYETTPVTTPYGLISSGCKADTTCHQAFREALIDVCDLADAMGLDDLEQIAGLIDPYLWDDPRREISYADTQYNQDLARYWMQTRSEAILSMSGL